MERKVNWQAEQDLDTLLKEREIRKDTARMKAAQRLARERIEDTKAVADTRSQG